MERMQVGTGGESLMCVVKGEKAVQGSQMKSRIGCLQVQDPDAGEREKVVQDSRDRESLDVAFKDPDSLRHFGNREELTQPVLMNLHRQMDRYKKMRLMDGISGDLSSMRDGGVVQGSSSQAEEDVEAEEGLHECTREMVKEVFRRVRRCMGKERCEKSEGKSSRGLSVMYRDGLDGVTINKELVVKLIKLFGVDEGSEHLLESIQKMDELRNSFIYGIMEEMDSRGYEKGLADDGIRFRFWKGEKEYVLDPGRELTEHLTRSMLAGVADDEVMGREFKVQGS